MTVAKASYATVVALFALGGHVSWDRRTPAGVNDADVDFKGNGTVIAAAGGDDAVSGHGVNHDSIVIPDATEPVVLEEVGSGVFDDCLWLLFEVAFALFSVMRMWKRRNRYPGRCDEHVAETAVSMEPIEKQDFCCQTHPTPEELALDDLKAKVQDAVKEQDELTESLLAAEEDVNRWRRIWDAVSNELFSERERVAELGSKANAIAQQNRVQDNRLRKAMADFKLMGDRCRQSAAEVQQAEVEARAVRTLTDELREVDAKLQAQRERALDLQSVREDAMTCRAEVEAEEQLITRLQMHLGRLQQENCFTVSSSLTAATASPQVPNPSRRRASDVAVSPATPPKLLSPPMGPRVLSIAREIEAISMQSPNPDRKAPPIPRGTPATPVANSVDTSAKSVPEIALPPSVVDAQGGGTSGNVHSQKAVVSNLSLGATSSSASDRANRVGKSPITFRIDTGTTDSASASSSRSASQQMREKMAIRRQKLEAMRTVDSVCKNQSLPIACEAQTLNQNGSSSIGAQSPLSVTATSSHAETEVHANVCSTDLGVEDRSEVTEKVPIPDADGHVSVDPCANEAVLDARASAAEEEENEEEEEKKEREEEELNADVSLRLSSRGDDGEVAENDERGGDENSPYNGLTWSESISSCSPSTGLLTGSPSPVKQAVFSKGLDEEDEVLPDVALKVKPRIPG